MSKYSEMFIRKLKTGKYQGVMKYKDAKGEWRQITKTAKATLKRDAKKELQIWEKEIREAEEKELSIGYKDTRTISEVCLAFYKNQLNTGQIQRSTYKHQCDLFRETVEPYIGNCGFIDTDRTTFNKWITDLYQKGLKPSTIRNSMTLVTKVYKYYYDIEEIERYPFKNIKWPKKPSVKVTFLENEQMEELMNVITTYYEQGEWFWTAVNIAVLTGLRRGEICGLRWGDIDFKRGLLTVNSAIALGEDGNYTKPPKSKSSIRTFPLLPQVIEVLLNRKHYVEMEQGCPIENSWYVIGEAEEFKSPGTLDKKFRTMTRKYELKDFYGNYITMHGLRHNFATFGVRSNIDIASLSRMMGHATKSMTLDTYADASPEAMQLASAKMTASLNAESDYFDYNVETVEKVLQKKEEEDG